MIAYASRTGTRRNLAALRGAHWRLLVSARGALRTEGFDYALDNGAWTAHQKEQSFDELAFQKAVVALGKGADWVVAPDIVSGGLQSLSYSLQWMPWLQSRTRHVLIAVQDGMKQADVLPYIQLRRVGLAIGGSTQWKEKALATREFSGLNCYLHVLRVNTVRRIELCAWAGADSFDGSSVSRFACNLPRLEQARKRAEIQGLLW